MITIQEMADKLGISPIAVSKRLYTRKIKPAEKKGATNLYPDDTIEKINIAPKVVAPKVDMGIKCRIGVRGKYGDRFEIRAVNKTVSEALNIVKEYKKVYTHVAMIF